MNDFMIGKYILDEHHLALPCPDLMTWARFMEDIGKRRVSLDKREGVTVSTVFLGLDRRFGVGGDPLLFETMSFYPTKERGEETHCERYSTFAEALAGHERIKSMVWKEMDMAHAITQQLFEKEKVIK